MEISGRIVGSFRAREKNYNGGRGAEQDGMTFRRFGRKHYAMVEAVAKATDAAESF